MSRNGYPEHAGVNVSSHEYGKLSNVQIQLPTSAELISILSLTLTRDFSKWSLPISYITRPGQQTSRK